MIKRHKILFFLLFVPVAIFLFASSGEKELNLAKVDESKVIARTDLEDFDIFSLGVECETFDMTTDNNNTIHIIWQEDDGFHYGKISGTSIIEKELVPDTTQVVIKFQHPRLIVCPDGSSVHFAFIESSPGEEGIHVWRDDTGWHRETFWRKSGSFYISIPTVGKDLNGNLHLMAFKWTADGSRYRTSYFYKDSGQSHWTEVELVDSTNKFRDISFYIDRMGGVHTTWKCGVGEGYYAYAPSGSHIHEASVISIPPQGTDASNVGDLFLDQSDTLHHACLTYKNRMPYNIQYWKKDLDATSFTFKGFIKEEPLNTYNYDLWPAIGVDPQGRVYVAWAFWPLSSKIIDYVYLYVWENEEWTEILLDHDSDVDMHSKAAIAVTDFSVNVGWTTAGKELMLARRITGAAVLVTPSDGSNVCGNSVEIGVEVQGFESSDPLEKLDLYVDDSFIISSEEETLEYTLDISGWELGSKHVLKAIATKESGETEEKEAEITKDCSPEVIWLTCESGQENYDTMDMKGDASDDIALEKMEFYGDGRMRGEDDIPPYTAQWNITGWLKPKHDIVARAYDTSGNQGETLEIPIVFRNFSSPANITVENILNRTLFIMEWINVVRWESHPKNSGINIIGYRVYQIENGSISKLADLGPDQFEFVQRNVEEGKMYVYRITAVAMINGLEQESTTGTAAILSRR